MDFPFKDPLFVFCFETKSEDHFSCQSPPTCRILGCATATLPPPPPSFCFVLFGGLQLKVWIKDPLFFALSPKVRTSSCQCPPTCRIPGCATATLPPPPPPPHFVLFCFVWEGLQLKVWIKDPFVCSFVFGYEPKSEDHFSCQCPLPWQDSWLRHMCVKRSA